MKGENQIRYTVSIPFSTIKSNSFKRLVSTKVVSIPFSTIKRNIRDYQTLTVSLFQFHLVRLKECMNVRCLIRVKRFQFHLVRLKEYEPCKPVLGLSSFQFHLVRLKVKASLTLATRNKNVSIPFSTIKSWRRPSTTFLKRWSFNSI